MLHGRSKAMCDRSCYGVGVGVGDDGRGGGG